MVGTISDSEGNIFLKEKSLRQFLQSSSQLKAKKKKKSIISFRLGRGYIHTSTKDTVSVIDSLEQIQQRTLNSVRENHFILLMDFF